MNRYQAFDQAWFKKHRGKLLWFLNTRIVSRWFRWVMRIDFEGWIDDIAPNHLTVIRKRTKKRVYVTKRFRSHDKYAKRLYYAFRPLWWAMHILDLAIDPLVPALSFGFSTLTARSNAGANSPADGELQIGPEGSWAAAHDATDATNGDMSQDHYRGLVDFTGGQYYIYRSIACFTTSSIGAGQTIQATTKLRIYANTKTTGGTWSLLAATPLSTSSFSSTDFTRVGTSKVTADITAASITTGAYNNQTITDTSVINVSGITSIGLRETTHDLNNSAATGNVTLDCSAADHTGTSQDPELVVDYIATPFSVRVMFI
jgi:hypothetical protein